VYANFDKIKKLSTKKDNMLFCWVDNSILMMYNFSMNIIVEKAVQSVNRFSHYKKITVALSGGRDSVCLLDMLSRFCKDANISAIHINHNLRKESAQEEVFVQNLCDSYNIPLKIFKIDVMSELNGRSIETAAREMRHEIFSQEAKDETKIAVAHHMMDRAESILMHILRGSGVEGLVGMNYEDGHIIRPILDFMPEELDEYVKTFDLKFVIDSTNFDSTYDRNFVRLQVLPLLSKRYPAVKSLIKLSENAKTITNFASKFLDYNKVNFDGNKVTICAIDLQEKYSAYKYVLKAISLLGLKKDYTAHHINSVIGLANSQSGAKVCFLGITAKREFDNILLYKTQNDEKSTATQNEYLYEEGIFYFGQTKIKISKCNDKIDVFSKGFEFDGQAFDGKNKDKVSTVQDEENKSLNCNLNYDKKLFFDGDTIPQGAVIRFRRDGDKFRPYSCGEKKLKKYFIDKKIAQSRREIIPLIAVGNEILVVCGVEISDNIKCTSQTKNIMSLEIINN